MLDFVRLMTTVGTGDMLGSISPVMFIATGPDKTAMVYVRGDDGKIDEIAIQRLRAECGRLIEIAVSDDHQHVAVAIPVTLVGAVLLERLRLELEDILGVEVRKVYMPPDPFIEFCCGVLAAVPMAPVFESEAA